MRISGNTVRFSLFQPTLQDSSVDYKKPLGETGTEVKGANKHNSQIRVFAFEQEHAAAQRLIERRKGESFDIEKQDIDIDVTADEDGTLVASQGTTTAEIENAEGQKVTIQELATLSDFQRLVIMDGQLVHGLNKKISPQIVSSGTFFSQFKGAQDRIAILKQVGFNFQQAQATGSASSLSSFNSLIDGVEGDLEGLVLSLDNLLAQSPFNLRRGESSHPLHLSIAADRNAAKESFQVLLNQTARGVTIASTAVADHDAALGLEGSFSLNGVEVTIQATDSIEKIAFRINHGEDRNQNQVLDTSEDLNQDGILNLGEDLNGNGRLDTGEDLDRDGVFDAGEDLDHNGIFYVDEDDNYNRELDGGTIEHDIKARVVNNRLELSTDTLDAAFEIEDPDGVLRSLGLITIDDDGDVQSVDVLEAGRAARVTFEGDEFSSNNGIFENLRPGVDLTVQAAGGRTATVTIEDQFDGLFQSFSDFAETYNRTLTGLNELVKDGGTGSHNIRLSDARLTMAEPLVEQKEALNDAGISQLEERRRTVNSFLLSQSRQQLENGQEALLGQVANPAHVTQGLSRLGLQSNDSGQLSLDADTLAGFLSNRPDDADEVLSDSQGALRQLRDGAQDLLKEASQLDLARERQQAQSLTGLKDVLTSQGRISAFQNRGDFLLEALNPGIDLQV